MGFYERSRYKDGLSGKKPGWIVIDKKGHRAQEAGYRDHLKNKDLADQIRATGEAESGSSYQGSPSVPLTTGKRILLSAIGLLLIYWASSVTIWIHRGISAMQRQETCLCDPDFRSGDPDLSRRHESLLNVPTNVIQGRCDWPSLVFGFLIFPGGLLFWPGLILIGVASDSRN